jgi:hypothetical protein
MDHESRKQQIRQLMKFLQAKMSSPDEHSGEVIVRIHDVEAFARSQGMDEAAAWRMFKRLKGHTWDGHYIPGSRSEERGHTAARLVWVEPRVR